MMKQYHKIQTVFLRDPDNNHKTLLEGAWAKEEFGILQNIAWTATEKIDGTNIRIMWDGENVTFAGKSDNAHIPPHLLKVLETQFPNDLMAEVFGDSNEVCIYGEGYGNKIQKTGKHYIKNECDIIIFDCKVGSLWLTRPNVEDIGEKLAVDVVPIIDHIRLFEAIELVQEGFKSTISEDKDLISEGLILKPCIELFNRKGERIITKIKHKDFR